MIPLYNQLISRAGQRLNETNCKLLFEYVQTTKEKDPVVPMETDDYSHPTSSPNYNAEDNQNSYEHQSEYNYSSSEVEKNHDHQNDEKVNTYVSETNKS